MERIHAPLRIRGGVLLLLFVGTGVSKGHAQEVDPWWGRDKAAHVTVSVGLSALTYGLVRSQTDRRELAAASGLGVSILAGAAKEALDLAGVGNPSWRDFAWDAIGAALGVLVSLGVDLGASALFTEAKP